MPFLHIREQSLVAGENITIQDRLLTFLDSSHDKEHNDAQFLQNGVSMAKLQPLLNHCKFFMKCIFCTNCIILQTFVCAIMSGFRKSGHKYHDIHSK